MVQSSDDVYLRRSAVWALRDIGPATRPAIPALYAAIRERNAELYVDAAFAHWHLSGRPDVAVRALCEGLKETAPVRVHLRSLSAQALGNMGPGAKPALPVLTEAMADDRSFARRDAALALWQIDRQASRAVPVLRDCLRDRRSAYQRQQAAAALAEIGPEAKDAVPELIDAFHDRDRALRKQAGDALKKIDPEAAGKVGVP